MPQKLPLSPFGTNKKVIKRKSKLTLVSEKCIYLQFYHIKCAVTDTRWFHLLSCRMDLKRSLYWSLAEYKSITLKKHVHFSLFSSQVTSSPTLPKSSFSMQKRENSARSWTYVFPTLDPTKPPTPSTSLMKSCNSLFNTHLKKTHPGNRGFGLMEIVPFFNLLRSWTAGA